MTGLSDITSQKLIIVSSENLLTGNVIMSKKKKTQHQNYKYYVGIKDSFDWEAEIVAVTREFDTEEEAAIAAKEYSEKHGITSGNKSMKQVQVIRSNHS